MDHQYKSLLLNIATRHLISELNPEIIEEQLLKMRKFNLVNFFILGNLETVKQVIDAAWKNNFFNKKYAFYMITQSMDDPLTCEMNNGTLFFAIPKMKDSFKKRFSLLKNTYALDGKPEIAASFYFDITIQALFAVR